MSGRAARWRSASGRLSEALRLLGDRLHDTYDLLLDRRLWLVLGIDCVLLFTGLLEALAEGGDPSRLYRQLVLVPYLLLAVPTLSAVIALERRSGSLDLALATASTERYFVRRVLLVLAPFVLQGALVLVFGVERPGDLARGLTQALVSGLLIGAVVLFWAVRLRTSGAVLVASLLVLGLLGPWLFADPFPGRGLGMAEELLGLPRETWGWWWNLLVLCFATAVSYLYAQQRLRRPERLLR